MDGSQIAPHVSFPARAKSGAGSPCAAIARDGDGWGRSEGSPVALSANFPSKLLVFSGRAAEDGSVRSAGDVRPFRSAEGRKPRQRAALLQCQGVCADPCAPALQTHTPCASSAGCPDAPHQLNQQLPANGLSRGAPAPPGSTWADEGWRCWLPVLACCRPAAPQPAQLWGEENSSFPWELEEESFWGCSWDCASQERQQDPRASRLSSPLPGKAGTRPPAPLPTPREVPTPARGARGSPSPLPVLCQTRSDI